MTKSTMTGEGLHMVLVLRTDFPDFEASKTGLSRLKKYFEFIDINFSAEQFQPLM